AGRFAATGGLHLSGPKSRSAPWTDEASRRASAACNPVPVCFPVQRRLSRRFAMSDRLETATLAGGCFWCLEAVYEMLRGIEKVTSGYAGGHVPDPDYYAVCSGTTGHAEVVQLEYDPAEITYQDILDIF